MDWEMKAERLGGSPENVGAGMLRKDNNQWGARKEFRPGSRKAGGEIVLLLGEERREHNQVARL